MTAIADAPTGNPDVLEWCSVCVENVVALRDGTCPWCDTLTMTQEDKRAAEAERLPVKAVEDPAAEVRIPPKRDRRHNHGKSFSDEQLIARVLLWAQVLGEPPTKRDWQVAQLEAQARIDSARIDRLTRRIALYRMGDWPSETTVRERFGSMNALLVAAGFEPRPAGTRPKHNPPKRKFRPRSIEAIIADVEMYAARGERGRLKSVLYELAQAAIVLGDAIKQAPVEAAA